MVNSIGTTLVTALAGTIAIMLEESATEQRPYAVYSMSVRPYFTKAGEYKIAGTMEISIYCETYDALKTLVANVKEKISISFTGVEHRATLVSEENTCEEGVWSSGLVYSVAQYATNTQTTNN